MLICINFAKLNAVELAYFVASSEDTSNAAIALESATATFGKQINQWMSSML